MKAFVGVAVIFFAFAVVHSQEKTENNERSTANLALTKIAGKQLFTLKKCTECHTWPGESDENRSAIENMRDEGWFEEHVQENSEIVLRIETNRRRQRRVFREEIEALKAFLFEASPQERAQIDSLPAAVYEGAYLAYQNNCLRCHTIAGVGKDIGPDLSHIGTKHDKTWFIQNLIDPKQFAPDTEMPSFKDLPPESLEKIAAYLLSLR